MAATRKTGFDSIAEQFDKDWNSGKYEGKTLEDMYVEDAELERRARMNAQSQHSQHQHAQQQMMQQLGMVPPTSVDWIDPAMGNNPSAEVEELKQTVEVLKAQVEILWSLVPKKNQPKMEEGNADL